MKNEPWIDRVFRDNIPSLDLPVDLHHWHQAEALIIAAEKKEKKKRLIFWLTGLGVLSILTLSGIASFRSKSNLKEYQPKAPIEKAIPAAPVEVPKTSSSKPSDVAASSDKYLTIPTIVRSASEKSDHTSSKSTLSDGSVVDNITKESNHMDIKPAQTTPLTIASKVAKSNDKTLIATNEKKSSELSQESVANTHSPFLADGIRNELSIAAIESAHMNELFFDRKLPKNELESNASPIKITKPHWVEQGIKLALAKESGLGSLDPSISQAGIEWYRHSSVGKNFFYGVGLGYNSNFNKTRYAEVVTAYEFQGFGSTAYNYGIKPEWMHYAYTQAHLGAQWKKHRIIGGIRPELLLGAQGKIDQLQFKEGQSIKSITSAKVSPINEGWLENRTIAQLTWSMNISYEYRIMKKLGIGVQVNHALKSPYATLNTDFTQPSSASWNTGFRFSYILN